MRYETGAIESKDIMNVQHYRDEGQLHRHTARERPGEQQQTKPFESPADLEAFFRECDALDGPAVEPDWDEHLEVMAASRSCSLRPDNHASA